MRTTFDSPRYLCRCALHTRAFILVSIHLLQNNTLLCTGIQFRVLNASKGPAVRGPRAQMDRDLYKDAMLREMQSLPNLEIALGSVEDLDVCEQGRVRGVKVGAVTDSEGSTKPWHVRAERVVITTGTFLRGVIHCGTERVAAGRAGDEAATVLADTLRRVGFKTGRLKTGLHPYVYSMHQKTENLCQSTTIRPLIKSRCHISSG